MEIGPALRRRRLGSELRRLRESQSLRLEDVAARLEVAPSTLSRIETGQAPTRTWYLAAMLDMYGIEDAAQRKLLTDLAKEGQRNGWWTQCDDLLAPGMSNYLGLEAGASVIRTFATDTIPGLAQVSAYTAAAITAVRPNLAADRVSQLVRLQARRQQLLDGDSEVHLVLDEAVLRRTIGMPSVMVQQLRGLLAMLDRSYLTLRVLSFPTPRELLTGSFTVLSFPDPADSEVACFSGVQGQVIREERQAGVLAALNAFNQLSAMALPSSESAGLIKALLQPPTS